MSQARSTAGTVILIKGILNTLLGALHIVGTFTFEAAKIAGQGTPLLQRDYLVWFFGVGAFIVFLGVVDLLCWRGLNDHAGEPRRSLAWRVLLVDALFTTAIGLVGVSIYGLSPPLQGLITGIAASLVLLAPRRAVLRQPIVRP